MFARLISTGSAGGEITAGICKNGTVPIAGTCVNGFYPNGGFCGGTGTYPTG